VRREDPCVRGAKGLTVVEDASYVNATWGDGEEAVVVGAADGTEESGRGNADCAKPKESGLDARCPGESNAEVSGRGSAA